MKKLFFLTVFFAMTGCMFTAACLAATIITSPIDSRPISVEYLSNLTDIAGDTLISVDKKNLDYFSAIDANNYYGNSEAVREDLYKIVSENNNSDTTVIINTSTYITKGLVGSRCGNHYSNYLKAIEDLERLVMENNEPTYYINLSMPRTLPETRGNKIWPDNEKVLGLMYFYSLYNRDVENINLIAAKYSRVTPVQLIMEWSYVENKKTEKGKEGLEPWESDFLAYFNANYRSKEPYRVYLMKYIEPFRRVTTIFNKLLKLENKGLIDEIIVSNDDFQLPDSITYLYNNTQADWIPTENGTPVKYSFARTYMNKGGYSIYNLLKANKNVYEAFKASKGLGENINFIFGTDEIPQLIYARDYSKRSQKSTYFAAVTTSNSRRAATFDVLSVNNLFANDLNFVRGSDNLTARQFGLYLYDYSNVTNFLPERAYEEMNKDFKEGKNVGLIEIYSAPVSVTGENTLFKLLYEKADTEGYKDLKLTDLSCYSAWNTNANAIGLGVAHAQVFGIAKDICDDEEAFLKAHVKMLGQHIIEDGIYTVRVKRQLSREPYVPNAQDLIKSEKLYPLLDSERLERAFKNTAYNVKGNYYKIDECKLSTCIFPWGRIFECLLDFDVSVSKF